MASTPKQGNGDSTNNNNGSVGNRKKSRGGKGSYLTKWLDKIVTAQSGVPNADFDYVPNVGWPNSSQFAPGYDPCRFMYGCPEPMSLPTLPSHYRPVQPLYTPDYHRYVQHANTARRRRHAKPEEHTMNYLQPKSFTDNQDYASLPPIVTSVGDTNSNSETNVNERDKQSSSSNNNKRRYSDPFIQGVEDEKNKDVDSESESDSDVSGSQVGSKLLMCLLDQIAALKAANERMNKDLIETRAELDSMRHQNAFLHKGSSPNMGATSNLNSNGQYSPGFLADLVREIRDATRVREEAMFSRVRAMMMERNDSSLASSEAKLTEKYLEEIKSSLRASEADKRCMMDRISKLEDDLRALRTNGLEPPECRILNGTEDPDAVRLRKELADMRKAKINAEEHALKLERLVTQLRSKFNGLQPTNGPESLPSDPEHETSRIRRTSINSSSNSTVVFGPVTDL